MRSSVLRAVSSTSSHVYCALSTGKYLGLLPRGAMFLCSTGPDLLCTTVICKVQNTKNLQEQQGYFCGEDRAFCQTVLDGHRGTGNSILALQL